MRFTTFLLVASFLSVSAASVAQKITVQFKNAPLQIVINAIQAQSGYGFVYNEKLLENAGPVSINVRNVNIDQALEQAMKDQNLVYFVKDKVVTIKAKTPAVIEKGMANPDPITITGTVKDDKGQPLPGVTVTEKGKENMVVSGTGGDFRMVVTDQSAILVFSYVGYQRQEIKIRSGTDIDVTLSPAINQLRDVVVSGYTVQNRAEFTGS